MDYKEEDELLKEETAKEEEFVYSEEAAEDYEANQVFMTPGQVTDLKLKEFLLHILQFMGILKKQL